MNSEQRRKLATDTPLQEITLTYVAIPPGGHNRRAIAGVLILRMF
jgi:hypothetical protein